MSAYGALLSARYRMTLQYRTAAVAGVATQFFWGFVLIMVMEAFFAVGVAPPMSFAATVSYIWLGQALLALMPWNHDREIEAMVQRGHVAYELLRPVDLYALWFVRAVAWRTAAASLRAIPIVAIAGGVLPFVGDGRWALQPPASSASALAFAGALGAAVLLAAAITTLVHVSLLWTLSGEGLARVMPAFVIFFSGMVVPLPFFPDWMQPLFEALPFRGLVDAPFRLYTGHIPPAAAPRAVGLSLVWTVALVWLGRRLLARGTRRLVVQGG